MDRKAVGVGGGDVKGVAVVDVDGIGFYDPSVGDTDGIAVRCACSGVDASTEVEDGLLVVQASVGTEVCDTIACDGDGIVDYRFTDVSKMVLGGTARGEAGADDEGSEYELRDVVAKEPVYDVKDAGFHCW